MDSEGAPTSGEERPLLAQHAVRVHSLLLPYAEQQQQCTYCHDSHNGRVSFGVGTPRLSVDMYDQMLERGWMRSGSFSYRPSNHHPQCCCPNIGIKVNVSRFAASKTHKRTLKAWRKLLSGDAPVRPRVIVARSAEALRKRVRKERSGAAGLAERSRPAPGSRKQRRSSSSGRQSGPQVPADAASKGAAVLLAASAQAACPDELRAAVGDGDGTTPAWARLIAAGMVPTRRVGGKSAGAASDPEAAKRLRPGVTAGGAMPLRLVGKAGAMALAERCAATGAAAALRVLSAGWLRPEAEAAVAAAPSAAASFRLVAARPGFLNVEADGADALAALARLWDRAAALASPARDDDEDEEKDEDEDEGGATPGGGGGGSEGGGGGGRDDVDPAMPVPERQAPLGPPPPAPTPGEDPSVWVERRARADAEAGLMALEEPWVLRLRFKHTRELSPFWPRGRPTGWRGAETEPQAAAAPVEEAGADSRAAAAAEEEHAAAASASSAPMTSAPRAEPAAAGGSSPAAAVPPGSTAAGDRPRRPPPTRWEAEHCPDAPRLRVRLCRPAYSEDAHEIYLRYNSEVHGSAASLSDREAFERHLLKSCLVPESARTLPEGALVARGAGAAAAALRQAAEGWDRHSLAVAEAFEREDQRTTLGLRRDALAAFRGLLSRAAALAGEQRQAAEWWSDLKPSFVPAQAEPPALLGSLFRRITGMQGPPPGAGAPVAGPPEPVSVPEACWAEDETLLDDIRRDFVAVTGGGAEAAALFDRTWPAVLTERCEHADHALRMAAQLRADAAGMEAEMTAVAEAAEAAALPLPPVLHAAWAHEGRVARQAAEAVWLAADIVDTDTIARWGRARSPLDGWLRQQGHLRLVDIAGTHARNRLWASAVGAWGAEGDRADTGERGAAAAAAHAPRRAASRRDGAASASAAAAQAPSSSSSTPTAPAPLPPLSDGLSLLYGTMGDPDAALAAQAPLPGFAGAPAPPAPSVDTSSEEVLPPPPAGETVPDSAFESWDRPPWELGPAEAEGWDLRHGYGTFLARYELDGSLVCFSVLDVLPSRVASVYMCYNPDLRHLQWGRVTALRELALADRMRRVSPALRWLDLNFIVPSCGRMTYKTECGPSLMLCPYTHRWVPAGTALPRLGARPHAALAPLADPARLCDPDSEAELGLGAGSEDADEARRAALLDVCDAGDGASPYWWGDLRPATVTATRPTRRALAERVGVLLDVQQDDIHRARSLPGVAVRAIPPPRRPEPPGPTPPKGSTHPPPRRVPAWPLGSDMRSAVDEAEGGDDGDSSDDDDDWGAAYRTALRASSGLSVELRAMMRQLRAQGRTSRRVIPERQGSTIVHVQGSGDYFDLAEINPPARRAVESLDTELLALLSPRLAARGLLDPRGFMHFARLEDVREEREAAAEHEGREPEDREQ